MECRGESHDVSTLWWEMSRTMSASGRRLRMSTCTTCTIAPKYAHDAQALLAQTKAEQKYESGNDACSRQQTKSHLQIPTFPPCRPALPSRQSETGFDGEFSRVPTTGGERERERAENRERARGRAERERRERAERERGPGFSMEPERVFQRGSGCLVYVSGGFWRV